MAKDSTKIVILLDRGKIQLFAAGVADVQNLNLEQTVFKDLEIVDKNKFSAAIDSLLARIKLAPGEAFVILSDNVCFMKDFGQSLKENLEGAANTFFSAVPFDSVISKAVELPGITRATAANKEVLDTLAESLEARGFEISLVIPAFVVEGMDAKVGLTNEVGQKVIAKAEAYQKYNFLAPEAEEFPTPSQPATPRKINLTLILLLVLLVSFVILLGFLFLRT